MTLSMFGSIKLKLKSVLLLHLTIAEVEFLVCRADLNEILSCTEFELTSTEETISETLRNGGSCVQSNRSNVLQVEEQHENCFVS